MNQDSSDDNQQQTSYMVRTLTAILFSITDVFTQQAEEFFQHLLLYLVFLYQSFVETGFLMIECIGHLFRNGIQSLVVHSSTGEPFRVTMKQAARSGGILMWNIFQGFLQIVKNFSKNPEEFLESESECKPNGGR